MIRSGESESSRRCVLRGFFAMSHLDTYGMPFQY
jgi:hypothetical protein